jgi:hypothetical protein
MFRKMPSVASAGGRVACHDNALCSWAQCQCSAVLSTRAAARATPDAKTLIPRQNAVVRATSFFLLSLSFAPENPFFALLSHLHIGLVSPSAATMRHGRQRR